MNETYSEKYRELRNLNGVRQRFVNSRVITKEAQNSWFNRYLKSPNEYMFAILDNGGQFLGGCSLYEWKEDTCEFGRLIIDPLKSGKGYGENAVRAALMIGKLNGINHIKLDVYSDNIPALTVYKKVGFSITGYLNDTEGNRMFHMEIELS